MNDPRLLWWIDRSAGLVALVLLTIVMLLGALATGRSERLLSWRVLLQGLHRELPLVAGVLLAVHIATAVVDSFVPLSPLDVVVPFAAGYRPLWIGLGTLSFDLLVAVVLTSLLRTRLGHRSWRVVHWSAYALWPLAVVHGLGSGSDMHARTVHQLGAVCVGVVLLAILWRLLWSGAPALLRLVCAAAVLIASLGVAQWASHGPLAPGWAKKAAAARLLP